MFDHCFPREGNRPARCYKFFAETVSRFRDPGCHRYDRHFASFVRARAKRPEIRPGAGCTWKWMVMENLLKNRPTLVVVAVVAADAACAARAEGAA